MGRVVGNAWLILGLAIAGCAKPEDYFEVVREQRAAYSEMADILASVKNDQTMADALTAIEKRRPQFEAIARKANALPKPPPAEVVDRLQSEKYLMTTIVKRLLKEGARIENDVPGGADFMKQFHSRSSSLRSAVQP